MMFALMMGLSAVTFLEPVEAATGANSILIIVKDGGPNKFGRYLGEILRAEGLNSYDIIDVGTLTAGQLTAHDVTILAETTLTAGQATLLSNYVNGGGWLIAMRPDAQIADLFGLDTGAGTLTDGYLKMNGAGPAQGLTTATLQIHGTSDRYTTLGGAVVIAQLYSDATTATAYPAVVSSADGHAVAFMYDLAHNVVYSRQGNPANANVDADGDTVIRTIDLFQDSGGGAPWVDRDRISIPQADEQQRLLARLVQLAITPTTPMPQLWYFPGTAKTVMVPTGDAHANPIEWYQSLIDSMNANNAPITLYMAIGGSVSIDDMNTWRSQGHEFGIHPYNNHPDSYPPFNITSLTEGYSVYDNWWNMTFGIPYSRTVRNHQVAWLGWTDAADLAVSYNMGMDTNFYHWGGWLKKPDDTWPHGYITGSGQPMKFIRADGTILPYYQQLTQLVDEQLVTGAGTAGSYENLSITDATTVSKQLIDQSLAGDYAALMTQFHVDYINETKQWVEDTLAYANSKNVPILNADQWLTFTETRHDTNLTTIRWNPLTASVTFNMTSAATPNVNLTTIMPLTYNGYPLISIKVDGVLKSFSVQTIKGTNVAFFTVPAGNHSVSALYTQPTPTPSPTFTPTPTPTPTATPVPVVNYSGTNVPPLNYLSSKTLVLSWSKVSWAVAYQVQVDNSNDFSSTLIDRTLPSSALSTSVTLPSGGTYYWRVRAQAANGGWSSWSVIATFTIAGA
jgi:hypothetical protein